MIKERLEKIARIFAGKLIGSDNEIIQGIGYLTVRLDAWYLVAIGVILTLAATIWAGLFIWCVVYARGRFTGGFSFANWGFSVWAECK